MLANLLPLRRNDADAFAVIHAGGEVIDDQAVDPRADKADDYHTEVVDSKCRAADDSATDTNRHTDIKMQILVDNLSQYIQSARRGVHAELKGLTSTQQEYEAHQVKPHVAGSQTGSHHRVLHLHQHFAGTTQ